MNVKGIFGENLKHFRKANKITQEALSERQNFWTHFV